MNQAEKLQKLIELAKANGFNKKYGAYHETQTCINNDKITCIQFPVSLETYIFDPEFIKALCKAKWGEQVDNPSDSKINLYKENPFHQRNDLAWHGVITHVAICISENRIDYLYNTFI